MSYKEKFPEAFDAMMQEMERHQPEKGDSWETCDIHYLKKALIKAVNEYYIGATHALDIANLAVMVHLRLKEAEK